MPAALNIGMAGSDQNTYMEKVAESVSVLSANGSSHYHFGRSGLVLRLSRHLRSAQPDAWAYGSTADDIEGCHRA